MANEVTDATSFAWTATSGYGTYPPYVNLTGNRLTVRGTEKTDSSGGFCVAGDYALVDLPDEAIRELSLAMRAAANKDAGVSDLTEEETAVLVERINSSSYLQPVEDAGGGWLPIETCPRGKPGFLACNDEDYDGIEWLICHNWGDEKHRFLNQNSGNYSRADWWTHWRPLPAPPRADQSNGGE